MVVSSLRRKPGINAPVVITAETFYAYTYARCTHEYISSSQRYVYVNSLDGVHTKVREILLVRNVYVERITSGGYRILFMIGVIFLIMLLRYVSYV